MSFGLLMMSAVYDDPFPVMLMEYIFFMDMFGGTGVELCMN